MTNEILTGALVLITGFYAWATYKILKANERVVEVMHEQAEAVTDLMWQYPRYWNLTTLFSICA